MKQETQTIAPALPDLLPELTTGLTIALGVTLPTETITARNGIFGISGSGKTYSASDVAEEMLAAFMQIVVFDPLGVWRGLASVAEGQEPVDGTPLYIFGGDHADVPLDPSSGVAMADLIVNDGLSVVLDMSGFDDDAQMATFVAAFSTRLLKINREAIHVFVDEADLFVPEQAGNKEETASRKAVDNMVRRGRKGGIGVTLISQRPAVVAKNVLSQCTTLLVHQLTGAADQNAMAKWFGDHGTAEEQKAVTASLSSLGRGEAWIWTPGLQQLVRAQMRKRRTFDSSATPKFGEKPITPRRLAAPDLADLRERLAVQVEAEKENDVDALKGRIKELTEQVKELKARPATGEPKVVTETVVKTEYVEVPVFREGEAERLRETADNMAGLAKDLMAVGGDIKAALLSSVSVGAKEEAKAEQPAPIPSAKPATVPPLSREREIVEAELGGVPEAKKLPKSAPTVSTSSSSPVRASLSMGQKKVLDGIATWAALGIDAPLRANVATWTGYSATGGGYVSLLSQLKALGLVIYPSGDSVTLTEAGKRAASASVGDLSSVTDLHSAWMKRLTGPQAKVLRELIAAYPEPLTREGLAKTLGYSATGGGYVQILSQLRGLGVADYPNGKTVTATALLFPPELVAHHI